MHFFDAFFYLFFELWYKREKVKISSVLNYLKCSHIVRKSKMRLLFKSPIDTDNFWAKCGTLKFWNSLVFACFRFIKSVMFGLKTRNLLTSIKTHFSIYGFQNFENRLSQFLITDVYTSSLLFRCFPSFWDFWFSFGSNSTEKLFQTYY